MDDFLGGFTVDESLDAAPRASVRSRRRSARPVTEKAVKEGVIAELKRQGYALAKHMTGLGQRGTPDVFACVAGRMVVIEVKTIGYDLQPDQRAELRKWQNAGALTGWVRSLTHLHELLEHLNDPSWRNDFAHPGDGRGVGEPW